MIRTYIVFALACVARAARLTYAPNALERSIGSLASSNSIDRLRSVLLHPSRANAMHMIDTMRMPSETFEIGQEVQAKVAFDADLKVGEEVPAYKPISAFRVGDEVLAKVTNIIGAFGAFCSIGSNEDALLRREDLSGDPPKDIHDVLKVGDLVPVVIKKIDPDRGQVHLACKGLRVNEHQVIRRLEVGETVTAKVRSIEEGVGATLDVESDGDAFMHISDISDDAPDFISDVFKEGDIIQARVKTIFSPQTGLVGLTNRQERKPFSNVERGQDVMCKVVARANWGVFCDIGTDSNGLLHIADMEDPPKRVSAEFKVGDTFQARIKRIDTMRKRILLTTKRDVKHFRDFTVGEEVTGKVTNIIDHIVFVSIGSDEDAMLRKSEVDLDPGESLREKFAVGDEVTATVKSFDEDRNRIIVSQLDEGVSSKTKSLQAAKDIDDFEVGQDVTAKVLRIAGSFGAFCDIGCTHDAFLHISDLSDEPFADIHDMLTIGDTIEARVKKMNSGRKQIHIQSRSSEKNVKRFEEIEVGEKVEARVQTISTQGYLCDIGADVDAMLHKSDMPHEDRVTAFRYGDIIEARVKKLLPSKRAVYITTRKPEKVPSTSFAPRQEQAPVNDLRNEASFAKAVTKAITPVQNRDEQGLKKAAMAKALKDVKVKAPANNLKNGQGVSAKVPSSSVNNRQEVKAKVPVNDLSNGQEITAEAASNELEIGQEVKAKVVSVLDAFGAYVQFGSSERALMKMSDLFDEPPEDIHDVLKVGDTLVATVKRAEWPPLLQKSMKDAVRSKANA